MLFSGQQDGPRLNILVYLPAKSKRPAPVFVGLNFGGNHTVQADPGIFLSTAWIPNAPG